MELQYLLADPAGNRTLFILTPVPAEARGRIAKALMSRPDLACEQVGFVHDGRMDMMGGEFCGNASRSYGAMLAREQGLSLPASLQVAVSGSGETLTVTVRPAGKNACTAAISMPLPRRIVSLPDTALGGVTAVAYEGITHLVLDSREPEEGDLACAQALVRQCGFCEDCVGLLYLKNGFLRPRVFVRDSDTLVWESSCASGTCAVTAALAANAKQSVTLDLPQPGGVLRCEAVWENGLVSLTLDGPVTFPLSGTVSV